LEANDQEAIPTYMAPAVWVTILCFPLTGFWAIVQSTRVMTLLEAGDREGARAASRTARKWVIASIFIGGAVLLLTVIVGALAIYYFTNVWIPMIEKGSAVPDGI
jgi:hypothetical protein